MEINNLNATQGNHVKQEMAGIFTRTKQILELMDEAQSKVSSLEEVLKEKNNAYEALYNTLQDYKKSHCQNNVFIETHEQMREIIKGKHRKILDLAQIIYTSCQDISKEIHTGQMKSKAIVELSNKNQKKLKIQQRKFDIETRKLDEQSEAIANNLKETEALRNMERDSNVSLERELDDLEKEIKKYEDSQNKKEQFLNEKETAEENVGQKTIEEIISVDNEIKNCMEQLQEKEKKMLQEITDIKNNLTGIEEESVRKNNIVIKKKAEIETLAGGLEQIQNQLKSIEENIKIIEYELNNYEKEAAYINSYIKLNDENHKKDITTLQQRICEQENKLLQQEQCKINISEEISSTTSKNDMLSNEISEINNYIESTSKALIGNLEEQIFGADSNLRNLKLALKEMKNERNKKTVEMDVKTKQLELEIAELDLNNIKQQEEIAVLENKSAQDEEKKKSFISMVDNQQQILSHLETDVAKVKNDIQSQKLVTPKRNPNKKTKLERLPKQSNWDSDSSIEGLDRTVAMKTLEKFRKRQGEKLK